MADVEPQEPERSLEEAARAELAEEAPERAGHVTRLEDEGRGRSYWIVGTAHVSQDSVDEVAAVLEEVRPDVVCVELDPTRLEALTSEERWAKLDVFEVIRDGKTLMLLAHLVVGAYQRRLGAELGIQPGAELLAAVKKAEEIGARVELVDRDIQITLRRTWGNIGFWQKMKLLGALMASTLVGEEVDQETIEKLKEQSQLSEMLAEFARIFPEVKAPLIDERDAWLMGKIEDVPEVQGEPPVQRIVGVVGAAHVPGMVERFGQVLDEQTLSATPPRSRWVGLLKWILPAIVFAAFAIGWSKHEGQTVEEMLFAWIIPNAVAAGLLTALAGAKLLSIITATFVSPVTSLNPLLGAGMVVGLLEAWLRKPTVEDAQRIPDDVQSFAGLYRNRFTRVLLVAVLSTMGSALGAWIGATWMVSLLT